jgi:serine-type D-Ala-D-Ala carboxypeptidase (penicillin-binding protein 5/6)
MIYRRYTTLLLLLCTGLLSACANSPLASTPSYQPAYAGTARAAYAQGVQPASYSAQASQSVVQPAFYRPSMEEPTRLAASGAPGIRAESYVLVDVSSGVPIVSRNANVHRGAASTQKIITALVVLDAGNLDKRVTIQASDIAVEPTRLGVRPGQTYTRRELLYAFLIKSANDVARVLARDNAGSQDAFAARMNAKARSLGMTSSHFTNPHGLTASGQFSTANDMARAGLAAYQSPIIRDAVRQKHHTFHFSDGKTVVLTNTNELLGRMPECNGMKTGYTVAAGRCLISSASKNGRAVLLVQMGTKTKYIWDDAETLMSWGLRRTAR